MNITPQLTMTYQYVVTLWISVVTCYIVTRTLY